MQPPNVVTPRPMARYPQPLAQQPSGVDLGAVAGAALLVGAVVLALPRGNNGGTPMEQQAKGGVWREVARWSARGYLGYRLLEPTLAPMLAEMAAALPSLQQPAMPSPSLQPVTPTPPPQQSRVQTEQTFAQVVEQLCASTAAAAPPEAANDVFAPPPDTPWLRLAPHPSVILVLGKRGSGKSALGYRLLELFRNQAVPYVVGLPQSARKLRPDWIGCANSLEDVPSKAVVLLDESYIKYHARDSMSDEGRTIGQMVNLSRQRAQTLIFIVQEARQLDVNAISQADVIAVKELSEISRDFERRELKRFTDKARTAFAGAKGNRQRWTWVYSEAAGEAGLVENELASYWKPALSRAFAQATPDQNSNGAGQRMGVKTSREELKGRALALRQQDQSYGVIGKILGISKTLAWELVNGPNEPSITD